jgi:hypothetical protein
MNPLNTPHIFHHFMPNGYPDCAINLGEVPSSENEQSKLLKELLQRLCRAYRAAYDLECPEKDDMWAEVSKKHYQQLHHFILREDLSQIYAILKNAIHNEVCFGLGSGPSWYKKIQAPEHSPSIGATILDRFISLAEFLGILESENPEDVENYGKNIYTSPQVLFAKIQEKLKIDIATPKFIGLFGLDINGHLLTVRTPDCLYTSYIMSLLTKREKIEQVFEIGGGFGLCSYYFSLMNPACRYTIYDLPMVNFIQGFYLAQALDADSVSFFGEEKKGRIDLCPSSQFGDQNLENGLIFSQDVFPELDPAIIDQYLDKILHSNSRYFLTINHDKKYLIPNYNSELSEHSDRSEFYFKSQLEQAFRDQLIYRSRYWIRKGYLEELFSLK